MTTCPWMTRARGCGRGRPLGTTCRRQRFALLWGSLGAGRGCRERLPQSEPVDPRPRPHPRADDPANHVQQERIRWDEAATGSVTNGFGRKLSLPDAAACDAVKVVPEPPGLRHVGAKASPLSSGDDARLRRRNLRFGRARAVGHERGSPGEEAAGPDGPVQWASREARGARDGAPSLVTGSPSGPLSGPRPPPRPETAPTQRLRLQAAQAPAPRLPHGPAARPQPFTHRVAPWVPLSYPPPSRWSRRARWDL